jgi:hypothetical protein
LKSGAAGSDAGQQNDSPSSHEVEQLKMRVAELESQLKTEAKVKT